MNITRKQFTAAIEAGIAVSDLEPHEEETLLVIAATAKHVGHDYASDCPATVAGLDNGRYEVRAFAHGYDDFLIRALGRDWVFGEDLAIS